MDRSDEKGWGRSQDPPYIGEPGVRSRRNWNRRHPVTERPSFNLNHQFRSAIFPPDVSLAVSDLGNACIPNLLACRSLHVNVSTATTARLRVSNVCKTDRHAQSASRSHDRSDNCSRESETVHRQEAPPLRIPKVMTEAYGKVIRGCTGAHRVVTCT